MSKVALISKNLVLNEYQNTKPRYPLSGIILIQDEIIHDIIIIDPNTPISEIMSEYSDWNPIDYSNHYISPGIIDINSRSEWDSFETLTNEAAKGGITLLIVEPGYYQPLPPIESLYCDISFVQVVDDDTIFDKIPKNICALKAYLYQPAPEIKSVVNLQRIIYQANKQDLTLIIDPNLPDPRMLYIASPLRLESLESRSSTEITNSNSIFPAAYAEALDGSSKSGESEEEFAPLPLKSNSFQPAEAQSFLIHQRSNSDDKISPGLQKNEPEILVKEEEEKNLTPFMNFRTQKKGYRKYSTNSDFELDDKIKKNSQSIVDLCTAEKSTYLSSGKTNFLELDIPTKSASMTSFKLSAILSIDLQAIEDTQDEKSPLSKPQPLSARRSLRPNPIQINTIVKPDVSKDYNCCLANYPEHWESAGVEKIFECLRPEYRIHFANLSSAGALNRVRKGKEKFARITSEISAVHFCFTSASVSYGDTRFKNSPPIRNQGNYNCLWDLLKAEGIDCISSQHASIEPSRKLNGNFQQALNGISSIGCTLQAIWNKINFIEYSPKQLENYIVRLAKWFSIFPAKVLNMSDKRGGIAKGKYADLFIWDPYEKYVIGSDYAYSQTSPFTQQDAMGKIIRVYIRGKITFDRGTSNAVGIEISR